MHRTIRETPRLTLSMLVRNEAQRYLSRVLEAAREYIDDALIVDDASTDNTVALCREKLGDIPLTLVTNRHSLFQNEWQARKRQWDETIALDPDWILFLDADEIFEDAFGAHVRQLIADQTCDAYLFRLYDFWDENHYRDDPLWCAHTVYRPFMIRYQKDFPYEFRQTSQHCGRLPANIFTLPYQLSPMRLKHFGWAKPEDRAEKYRRYMRLDPGGILGSLAQYESILDKNVNLVAWQEQL